MASNYTSNYNLCQWAASDKVLRTEFNADNAKIDAAVKAVDRKADGKADQSALLALSQTVSQGLDLRNCRFVTGSYTGSGEYGSKHPNTLTFPGKPVFLCVGADDYASTDLIAIRGQSAVWHSASNDGVQQVVTWSSRSTSWYLDRSVNANYSAAKQMNAANTAYHYFAILEIE